MNCFMHDAQPAVGICKSCGKGLCRACVTEVSNQLACRGSCEGRVALLNRIVDLSAENLVVAKSQARTHGLLSIVLGLGFVVFGLWAYHGVMAGLGIFGVAMGATIVIYGVARTFGKRRLVA